MRYLRISVVLAALVAALAAYNAPTTSSRSLAGGFDNGTIGSSNSGPWVEFRCSICE